MNRVSINPSILESDSRQFEAAFGAPQPQGTNKFSQLIFLEIGTMFISKMFV